MTSDTITMLDSLCAYYLLFKLLVISSSSGNLLMHNVFYWVLVVLIVVTDEYQPSVLLAVHMVFGQDFWSVVEMHLILVTADVTSSLRQKAICLSLHVLTPFRNVDLLHL